MTWKDEDGYEHVGEEPNDSDLTGTWVDDMADARNPLPYKKIDWGSAVRKIEKPWGYEVHWAVTEKYVGKILHINEGHKLSLQYHEQKDETIYLLEGEMILTLDGEEIEMSAGESKRIFPGHVHRFEAIRECTVLEASTPEITDVVRVEDDYGRK